ncbi:hypothetical protein EXE06_12400 [Acinetobacter pittii]|uniref:hypothetical protein n=1 Tax=Acinetobacter pittii TaxID=48296 RepID=UPI0010237C93|nr:hypothetical protein [Acinetobacter pittii]MCU4429294.1 hypothetical protein [Acinetobacter pittii]RZG81976.1 hypothetical protein EXE06_12400 [Acinetobacter pittii]RZH53576.1 hypothetical protein EXD88_12810 [Acinetobacter pittii]RZH56330.1 hypothetical protein EXD90_15350 [Acinetobacter pittii]
MNKFLVFFKKNKEVIVLIPTFLGGMYQLLNIIILVGLPYVRYFSVAQVIPDGLLLSVVFFWLYVSFKLIMKFYNLLNENNNKRKENNLFFDIFYILFFSCLGGFFFYNAYMEKDLTSFSIILIRYITFALALLLITSAIKHFLSITSCDRKLKIKIKKLSIDAKKFWGNIIVISILAILVRVIPNEISLINTVFVKVNNFENYNSFSKDIRKLYKIKSDPKLLYINKDYVFLQIDENKILVLDAKNLTEIKKDPVANNK